MSTGGSAVRDRIKKIALWGVHHNAEIHYAEIRPIQGEHAPFKLPITVDCAGWATDCYAWAKAPDPNGLGYNGTGYTGTLLDHCKHIPLEEALHGDLIVFGPGTGEHVVILVHKGDTPETTKVVSHGQEAGPLLIDLATEQRAHDPPTTVLRCPGLDGAAEAKGGPPREGVHPATRTNPPREEGLKGLPVEEHFGDLGKNAHEEVGPNR